MSIIISTRGGRHTTAHRIAELEARNAELEAENAALVGANEDLVCELTRVIVRSCNDELRIAAAEEENGRLKARVKALGDKVIRAGAEHARLRQAVINARPRISVAVQQLDRPYVSHVQVPYPVPVGRSTANDETQLLPLIEQPEPWPVYATAATT
ncbi:hypothetical protein [Streptomyces sp. NPDC088736]|uniref:hypothetical protein n=1 Tax=Streptomyces sp. NPDC088736 TaxID=3365881 RepID=UPI003813ACBA